MLSIVFTFYRTLDLNHLERAITSLAKQTIWPLNDPKDELLFVDNNTEYDEADIRGVIEPHFKYPFLNYHSCKHGDPNKRHSWSANYGIRHARNSKIFFTRADYILMEDAIEKMDAIWKEGRFVSGWCWQMGCKRQEVADRLCLVYDKDPEYESYAWRSNVRNLLQHPNAHSFPETDMDAGTYMTSKAAMKVGGWYDEAMIGFGYQQSTLQRRMAEGGIAMMVVPEYLFCHQHHEAERDFDKALQEYRNSRGG